MISVAEKNFNGLHIIQTFGIGGEITRALISEAKP
jgi:hypothetical protein